MTKFSIPQAAFSGYRLLLAKPGAALAWFLFQFAVTLFITWLTVIMVGPQITQLREMQASGAPDPATMMALGAQTMPFNILSSAFALVTGAILSAAVLRATLRPANGSLGYLRMGGDEFRVVIVSLVVGILLGLAVVVAYIMGLIALIAVGRGAAGQAMQGLGAMPPAALYAAGAAALPGVVLSLFLYVKLSLSLPQTIGEKAIRIFGSWGLLKGVFWRTFATYILAAIPLALAIAALIGGGIAIHGDDWKSVTQPHVSSMGAAFSGGQLVFYALKALLMTIYSAALLTPAAVIYAAASGYTAPVGGSDDDDDDDDDDED